MLTFRLFPPCKHNVNDYSLICSIILFCIEALSKQRYSCWLSWMQLSCMHRRGTYDKSTAFSEWPKWCRNGSNQGDARDFFLPLFRYYYSLLSVYCPSVSFYALRNKYPDTNRPAWIFMRESRRLPRLFRYFTPESKKWNKKPSTWISL